MKGDMRMTSIQGKIAAVTGAASGIGRGLAEVLAARGARLALADVNAEGLEETAAMLRGKTEISTHLVDVSKREVVEGFAAEVAQAHGGADLIFNNAGVTVRQSIEEVSYADFEFVFNVDFWGVVYGTKAFLPLFRQRGAGHVINIASINAMVPFSKNGPYNAAKYAVLGFSETLMQELAGTGIQVTCVHPGGIRTNIARSAKGISGKEAARFERMARTKPDEAAEIIVSGVERNQQRVYVGTDAKIMAAAKRVMPALTVATVGKLSNDFKAPRLLRRRRP